MVHAHIFLSMTSYPTLFDLAPPPPEPKGLARRSDPESAQIAAASVNARALENRVCAYLSFVYPQDRSTKELASEMSIDRLSVSPRMKPLEKQGRVMRTGIRRDGCETWRFVKV